jgi:hypothetical protein
MAKELRYLDDWQWEVKNQKRSAKEFLDISTYKNIRTGIAGGLYYAQDIQSCRCLMENIHSQSRTWIWIQVLLKMYFAKSVTRIVTRLARLIKELQQCHSMSKKEGSRRKESFSSPIFGLVRNRPSNRRKGWTYFDRESCRWTR